MGQVVRDRGHEVHVQSISDGGEGFLDPFLSDGAEEVKCMVSDPIGRPVQAGYAIHNGKAIIEMARASGLELVAADVRDIMKSTTYGTGQLLHDAFQRGVNSVVVSLGGSATNDGGMGMMRAMGVKFSAEDREITSFTEACSITNISLNKYYEIFNNQIVTGACDVTNPLLGEHGATNIYARQKGADEKQVRLLEEQMRCYASKVSKVVGFDFTDEPGTGAAGGTGFALKSFFDATLTPGFDLMASAVQLEKWVDWADVVITGEGKLDHQTNFGKAPERLRVMAVARAKPVVAIVGILEDGAEQGYNAVYSLSQFAGSNDEARMRAAYWIKEATGKCMDDFTA